MNYSVKNILVPVDFSASSEVSMRAALEHFGDNADSITILSVYEGSEKNALPSSPDNEVDQMMAKSALVEMTRFKQMFEVEASQKKVVIETEILKGNPSNEIIATAKAKRADLIIMGSQGRGTLKSMFFGGTTYQVSRKAHCSVMVMRNN